MDALLSAAGVVRGAGGTHWNLRGSGTGEAILRDVTPASARGTALVQCVIDRAEGGGRVRDGFLTLSVPRGDRPRARFDGQVSQADSEGFIDLSGELTILGGTGCFQGASGSGPVTGTLDVTRRTFFVTGRVRGRRIPPGPQPGQDVILLDKRAARP